MQYSMVYDFGRLPRDRTNFDKRFMLFAWRLEITEYLDSVPEAQKCRGGFGSCQSQKFSALRIVAGWVVNAESSRRMISALSSLLRDKGLTLFAKQKEELEVD